MSPRTSLSIGILILLCACEAAANPGGMCTRTAECGGGLVCRFGRCRAECVTNRDCGAAQSCLETSDHAGACQLDLDLGCEGGVGRVCPAGLVCANDRCINPCTTNADCPSDGMCLFSAELGLRVCVDPGRMDLDAGPRPDGGVAFSPCSVVTHVCAGDGFACAIRDGRVFCWGDDTQNQHGDLRVSDYRSTFVAGPDMAPLEGIIDIRCGDAHACARNAAHDVLCWGQGGSGQLGDGGGTDTDRASYVHVGAGDIELAGGALDASQLVLGGPHSCTQRAADGHWLCWGSTANGAILPLVATGGTESFATYATELDHASTIAFGLEHSCVADPSGVNCRGAGGLEEVSDPTMLGSLGSVRELSAGQHHSCALSQTGVSCWGSDSVGQLGDGPSSPSDPSCSAPPCSFTPRPVMLPDVAHLVQSGSSNGACAITTDGSLWCWGENQSGEIDSTLSDRPAPVMQTGLPGFVCDAWRGAGTICAVVASTTGGDVWCWGDNTTGQLGIAPDPMTPHPTPVQILPP